MAKNYIDNLSEEVKKGMLEKAEQGGFPGKVPVGYINNEQTHEVDVDEARAGFIRRLFELYASGEYSLTALRAKCIAVGFRTRRSEKRISRSNLEKVLKNIFYTGHFYWDGNLYKGTHPPIVSAELFAAVQQAFKKHNKPQKMKKKDFAFAGLLTCGRCGCSITAEIKKGKYIYYRCTGSKGRCAEPYLREEALVERLGEVVRAIQIDREKVEWLTEALRLSHQEEKDYHDNILKNLQATYKKLQARIDQAYIDKLDGKVSHEFWHERNQDWRKEQDQIQIKMKAHQGANKNYLEDGVKILELANKAYSQYVRQSMPEKARLLKILLSNCTLKEEVLVLPTENRST